MSMRRFATTSAEATGPARPTTAAQPMCDLMPSATGFIAGSLAERCPSESCVLHDADVSSHGRPRFRQLHSIRVHVSSPRARRCVAALRRGGEPTLSAEQILALSKAALLVGLT